MTEDTILEPGDTIGILGGGQLGRMLALAASRLGLKSHIFCPEPDSPAFDVSAEATIADYRDSAALEKFAESVNVVTYEFENIPHETATELSQNVAVRPGIQPLMVSQDRLSEKEFLAGLGVSVAPFVRVDSAEDIEKASNQIEFPAILKTRRFGYDGKGQVLIGDAGDSKSAWEAIGGKPAVLESRIDFIAECSVIAARGIDGTTAIYDVAENVHKDHILKFSRVPATCLDLDGEEESEKLGRLICNSLKYVGVLAVELFVVESNGELNLIANEIAPRVHNSGHWTEDGCLISQFEQHVRAIAGWPLGSTQRLTDIEMENLIGDEALHWSELLQESNARIHLYGKKSVRPGRKMGHVNRLIAK